MKNITGKQLCKIVEQNGWELIRVHGSHHIYGKENSDIKLTIPVHSNKTIKIGLLKSILKSAGLLSLFFTIISNL